MKKIQAMLVLMIVLAFGGATAQTWAVVAQTLVPPQGVEKWAVLPQGVELTDQELMQTEGKWWWAVGGAALAVIGGIAEHTAAGRTYTWEDAAKDAVAGASGTLIGKVVGNAARAVERAIFVPRGFGNAGEAVGGALGAGAVRGALDRP